MADEQATQSEVGQQTGGHENFPPFAVGTFPSQLLWLAISFGLLYIVMARLALPKLGGLIEARKKRIAQDLDDATAMQQKADAAAAAHEKMIAEARAKAQALAQEARDKLAAEGETKRKALEAELAAKLAAAAPKRTRKPAAKKPAPKPVEVEEIEVPAVEDTDDEDSDDLDDA